MVDNRCGDFGESINGNIKSNLDNISCIVVYGTLFILLYVKCIKNSLNV